MINLNIAVIGAGNIGTLLAANLSKRNKVYLFTRNKNMNQMIDVYDKDENLLFTSRLEKICNEYDELKNCEYIFITYPSNVWHDKCDEISKFLNNESKIIFVPSMGGKEYMCKKIKENNIIIGMQRVPYVARLKEKGKSVYMLDEKKELFISLINSSNLDYVTNIEKMLNIKCTYIQNYLNLTLTPSNPILHTTRIYSMFKDNDFYDHEPFFYSEWDEISANTLFKCDYELQKLCQSLNKIDLSYVKSLKEHYEADTEEKFVKKMKSIESFKKIKAPVEEKNGKFFPDYTSRYFLEDFPFGLLIIKGFSVICNVETPTIDLIIMWVQKKLNKEYMIDNKLIGKDLIETGIPQNYGITTKEDIYHFYCNC